MKILKSSIIIVQTLLFVACLNAQTYLHVSEKNILDGNNNNFIIRSIGTGNWMLQEGYMMLSSDVADTQHEFRNKLNQTIGIDQTNTFYDTWLDNHMTKADVDSMAAWGFNWIRVAMHYKWFTLPIEEEPVLGENTWLTKGFDMIDLLLSWCEDNQMYLILDLHGAPGGQGANAAISDYDPTKPSLWESVHNKTKTIALWKKLAERYQDEEWIGGYDLLNEVNWDLGDNSPLRDLYVQITDSIRSIDQNHIIFIEGNGFANDFNGLTPPWDNNMVYSFHKYWTYNDKNALDWVIQLRNNYNIPLWMGEAGENSNTWFTNLVKLCEENNIGWSWWPVKKANINSILKVNVNDDYKQLLDHWRGSGSMSSSDAFQAVMTFADNHHISNCVIQYDVIDALIRQAHTADTKPFKNNSTSETIFAADYDLGRNAYAYSDTDTANYHLNSGNFEAWNKSWQYRNDGVDIRECDDSYANNGYCVEWIEEDEWLKYTIDSESDALYTFNFRTSGESQGGYLYVEVNGEIASERSYIPATGSWSNWRTTGISGVHVPEGQAEIKIYFDKRGFNFNCFEIVDPQSYTEIPFKIYFAKTHTVENIIYLTVSQDISSQDQDLNIDDFTVKINNQTISIESITRSVTNDRELIFALNEDFFFDDELTVTYDGSTVLSGTTNLIHISNFKVSNKTFEHHNIPGLIEAEDFHVNNGFSLEDCEDTGGGYNTAYADAGDRLDYFVKVTESGNYDISFRTALGGGNADITLLHDESGVMTAVDVVDFNSTGGWQTWVTQPDINYLPSGKYILRIQSRTGEFNLNWIELDKSVGIEKSFNDRSYLLFPNPSGDTVFLRFSGESKRIIRISDVKGKTYYNTYSDEEFIKIEIGSFPSGLYLVSVIDENSVKTEKLQIIH